MTTRKATAEPKAATGILRARTAGVSEALSPLNLHWAGVIMLALVCAFLLVEVGLLWQRANSDNAEALAQQRTTLMKARIAARPLEGVDVKLEDSRLEADRFYRERLPVSYSEIAEQLGVLARRDNVRLTRGQYAPKAVLGGAGTDQPGQQLSEVQLDYSLSGDYRSLVEFINGVERDRQFFLIDNISLTGQQTGQVNLRLRMTTYLRGVPPLELEQQVSTDAADPTGAATDLATAQVRQASAAGGQR